MYRSNVTEIPVAILYLSPLQASSNLNFPNSTSNARMSGQLFNIPSIRFKVACKSTKLNFSNPMDFRNFSRTLLTARSWRPKQEFYVLHSQFLESGYV